MSSISISSPDAPRSALFTCLACQVAFKSADIQREHYRSDWHRYNLKRKMAELPPINAELFSQKVLAQKQKAEDDEAAAATGNNNECKTCRKSYSSENAYQNHIVSKKHKETEAKLKANPRPIVEKAPETKSDVESITSKVAAHGLFIPDLEYLVDIEGLIKYLGEKISVGNICLYCNGKGRQIRSLEAVRKHMVDRGHCKIPYDTETDMMEIVDFYDFSSSYPEEQQRKMLEAAERADRGEAPLEEDDQELDADGLSSNGIRMGEDEMELILPSGARLGHRSLNKYYRQNVKPEE
ncbi:hypothetical protein BGZ76_000236, partial [Entomortierella beljakovae]